MHRYKKLALLGLLVVMLGSIAACSNSSSNNTGPKSLLANIKSSGELRVGFASAQPWQQVDAKTGQWEGVYVDVMADWAKTLGVKFVPVSTTWDNMIAGLQANQYDVASSLNARPARSIVVSFSNPLESDIGSFSLIPGTSNITTFAQLNVPSTTVCVQQGAAEDLSLSAAQSAGVVKVQITRLADQDSCRLAVTSGRVTAFFDDWNGNGPFAAANNGVKIIFPSAPFVDEGIGYAINFGYSYEDIAAINNQLVYFSASGKLAQSLKTWGATDPVKFAADPTDVPAYVKTLEASQYPGG
jgi:polar amino acid transport system substrate-binding protein